jgi:hypothetical protein
MATPLIDCTTEEKLSLIRFLWSEGVDASKMCGETTVQYDI